MKKIRLFFKIQKDSFLLNKWKYVLGCLCWFCFVALVISLQLFTMLENLHYVPVVLTVVFGVFVFLYGFIYGRLAVNSICISYFVFLIYGAIVTAFTSRDFTTFFLTQVKLTILMDIVFNFCINFYKPKIFLEILLVMTFSLVFLYVAVCWKGIFSLGGSSGETRVGNEFFGNVNYVGGALGAGVFFIAIYVCAYKKYILPLLLNVLFILFLIAKTQSRMPLVISVLSIIFVMFFFLWKKHKLWLLLALSVMAVGIVLFFSLPIFSEYAKRFSSIFAIFTGIGVEEASAAQRFSMQVSGFEFWLKSFFFGYGSSGFAQISSFGTYSHGTLCEVLCDFGIFGGIFFFGPLLYYCFWSKKNTLSWISFSAFLLCELLPMSFLGMLIYEKRFYVYIAIFASFFYEESKNEEFSVSFQRSSLRRFRDSFSICVPTRGLQK